MGTTEDDDARRGLEQKALRNVRGLVDRIEAEDRLGSRKQLVAVAIIVAMVALLGGAFLLGRGQDTVAPGKAAIEIPPPTKPVAK